MERARALGLARMAAGYIAEDHGVVTMDDVRTALGDGVLGQFDDLRFLGGVFKEPGWKRIGYIASERDECHHRTIGVFRKE